MKAAYMNTTYTLRTANQREHPVLSRTWLVPRGSFMFLIGMSGAADGDDVCETEFAAALKSVSIDKLALGSVIPHRGHMRD
jgi:CheY-specific phosphatase CheX